MLVLHQSKKGSDKGLTSETIVKYNLFYYMVLNLSLSIIPIGIQGLDIKRFISTVRG
jgi:hypothetical protein